MRKAIALLAVLGLTAGYFAANVSADKDDKKAEKFEATCPVSGTAAKQEHSVKHRGKMVYFCCPNCPKAFEADRKKFALKTNVQFLETKQITQVACPFAGKPVAADTAVALGKTTVSFCCGNCKAKAEKSEDLAALVFADFDKGFTLQTECPVSGKGIVAEHFAEHEGKKAYFCCPNCKAAFEKDPAKFTSKLPQFKVAKKGGKKKAE